MKTKRNIQRKRNHSYVLDPQKALKYIIEFLLMILFFSAGEIGYALAVGFFSGLVYARQNLLIISPLFIIAGGVFLTSWLGLVFLVVQPIVFVALYFMYTRFKKNVPTWSVLVCALICALAEGLTTLLINGGGLRFALTIVLTVIFALCCTNVCYAVLIRGVKCRFTLDEHICLGITSVAFAYACQGVAVYNFNLFFLVLPFIILALSASDKHGKVLIAGLLLGFGATLKALDFSLLGIGVVLAFLGWSLLVFHRFFSVIAMTLAVVMFWLLGIGNIGYESAILTFVGGMAYGLLPKEIRSHFLRPSKEKTDSLCAMVNRDRSNLSTRLLSVSDVFADLADCLDDQDSKENIYTSKRLSKEIAKNYCGKCPEKSKCFSAVGSDTSAILEGMCDAVLTRGKATILDVPTFITSRCVKTHNLLSVINNAGEQYKLKIAGNKELVSCKKIMSEQFAGMSLVLDSLSKEYGKNITFGGENEEMLENELMKHNIVATETLIAGAGASSRVALTVRDVDASKKMLVRTVSNCLNNPYIIEKIADKGDEKTVHLVTAPTFHIAYGIADKTRDGESVSGDSKAILSPSINKRIFALSDGMGSGEKASLSSQKSLNMIENFYKAGFEDGLILSLVNQLLCLVNEEHFSALDIAVVDTITGGVDIIKLGAPSSFILRKNAIEVLKSTSPPMGVVDKINSATARYQMYDGEMMILASDGIVDTLGENGVIDAVNEADTSNPQTLADRLLDCAIDKGADDDCTVVVLRLVAI